MAMCDSSRISDQPQLFRKYQIEGEVFVLNTYGGVLSKIQGEDIVVQSLLTECETYVLALLFGYYPHYAPYEELLSTLTDQSVESWRERLDDAYEQGQLLLELRRMRGVMGKVRKKLAHFRVDVLGVSRTGYRLMPLKLVPPSRLVERDSFKQNKEHVLAELIRLQA